MALRINTNIAALNAHRQLSDTDARLAVSMERLSSGYRINKAKDDVAGLSIANKFRLEVRGLRMSQQNVAQATALLQLGEGGAQKIETVIERLKELATTAASDNTDSDGRTRLNAEASKLLEEIDRIAQDTKYGSTQLLTGSVTMTFQIGSANTAAQDQISVNLTQGLETNDLALNNLSLSSLASAQAALTSIDNSLSSVNAVMGDIGAAQSRLEFASANLSITVENLSASESTIRDVDMAFEMISFTKSQILMQAGTAMLAQANMAPQNILALIGGGG
ncbi:MAG: flagellin FliC [Deltaproteobacteria bacterium]|nr:flagellin FliC [Deltaproteobacteria bacterium]